jgi:hypothetical protein
MAATVAAAMPTAISYNAVGARSSASSSAGSGTTSGPVTYEAESAASDAAI